MRSVVAMSVAFTLGAVAILPGCQCDDTPLDQLVPLLAVNTSRLVFQDMYLGGTRVGG